MSASARDPEDVLNVAFDQWDQYATAVAAEGVHGITFGAFARARLAAAGFVIVPREPSLTTKTAGQKSREDGSTIAEIWSAMLSAAEGKK